MKSKQADVLIIGSGIASLMLAELLSLEKNVIIITKSKLEHSNSIMAQGGIAAAIDKSDNWEDHFLDTIAAGAYHNHYELTKLLVQKGPQMIDVLLNLGVKFDSDASGSLSLGQEGAHRRRRILHSGGDATGLEIVSCLINRVKDKVTIIENEMAYELLLEGGECKGISTVNADGEISIYLAPYTVIATGGIGQLYEVTSNCNQITGDGLALAYRAGARLVDLEFIQFHPTMLVKNNRGLGLVSEAVRGEGARLITKSGKYLMEGKHELQDLAPRDIVAREIFAANQCGESLYLDITTINNFDKRFPTIAALCAKSGIDWTKGRIPVAPGAHFSMGGIETNQFGETSIAGLYAVGEVARTGVHGANRLASNSLLEGLVFAHEMAHNILQSHRKICDVTFSVNYPQEKYTDVLPSRHDIQRVMTKLVGIIRKKEDLIKAIKWFEQYKPLIYTNSFYLLSMEEKTICNMLTVGYLIAQSAFVRNESRGGHFREDFPTVNELWQSKKIYCSIEKPNPYIKKERESTETIGS